MDFDLCLAWNWEHDNHFSALLQETVTTQGLSFISVNPDNVVSIVSDLQEGRLGYRALLDRASDSEPDFLALSQWAIRKRAFRINPYENAARTWDKAVMHFLLTSAGLKTPTTAILPPYSQTGHSLALPLHFTCDRYTIKPAHGGGGEGVVCGTPSLDQALEARKVFPGDTYLLQHHIVPAKINDRLAWFRTLYCAGTIFPCWWDPDTHRYTTLTPAEEEQWSLFPLREITMALARISRLHLFSSEIALTPENVFMVVDYVNDPLDLRGQSQTADGVPEKILEEISLRLSRLVKENIGRQPLVS